MTIVAGTDEAVVERPVRVWELMHEFAAAIVLVADGLQDEGDRVYLRSTNDADLLRDLRRAYDEYRFETNDMGPES